MRGFDLQQLRSEPGEGHRLTGARIGDGLALGGHRASLCQLRIACRSLGSGTDMLTEEEAARFEGATLVSADGQEIGEVENLLTHAADNRAAWAVVTVDDKRVVVPLDGAE